MWIWTQLQYFFPNNLVMQRYLREDIILLIFNKRPQLLAFKSWSSWITKRFLATYDSSINVLTGVKSHRPSALQGPVSSCARFHKFINALEVLAHPPHTRCYRGEDVERRSSGKSLTFTRQVTPRRKRQTSKRDGKRARAQERQRPIFKCGCWWNLCRWRRPQTQTKTTTYCFDWDCTLFMQSCLIKRWTAQARSVHESAWENKPEMLLTNTRLMASTVQRRCVQQASNIHLN